MTNKKLIWYSIGWFLASVMTAVVAAIVLTEVVALTPLVESGETSYSVALNAIFLVILIVLCAVPFVFRERFRLPDQPDDEGESA